MIKHLENENEFENEVKEGLVFVDFYASWCNPCKMIGKVFEGLEDKINVLKIDVDEFPALANKFDVDSIPHVFIYKNGERVDDFLGYRGSDDIKEYLEKYSK